MTLTIELPPLVTAPFTEVPFPESSPETYWTWKVPVMTADDDEAETIVIEQTYRHCSVARGTIKIDPYRKREWCNALRSGRFRQIRERMDDGRGGRCSMGVLTTVTEGITRRTFQRDPLAAFLGISDQEMTAISSLVIAWNDTFQLSFPEIADRIEREF